MVYIEYGKIVVGTKSPPWQNPPKMRNLIYKSVYQNVYVEYGRVVVGIKSPQDKKMQKIQNLIYMIVYCNGVHRIW